MKTNLLFYILISFLFITSCDNDKDFYFDEPQKDHSIFLGLAKDVKSVSYEKQIFEITDGGYFPNNKENNDVVALMQYPYQSNELKYMANLNTSSVYNYPITANQYLITELLLIENIKSKNIKIELQNGKITSYSNQDDLNRDYKLICNYNDYGKLIQLKVNSRNSKIVNFKFKGDFIEQIIEKRKESTDTINYVFEKTSESKILIKRKNKNWSDKIITAYLNRTPNKTTLNKIVYEDDNQTFEFENNKIVLNTKVKADGNYDKYDKLEYENNQLKKILTSNSYEKNTVIYNLNNDRLISSINVETDKERMKNIGLTFDYKKNNKNEWKEMNYYVDRKHYDDAKNDIEKIKQQLRNYGYSELEISFHNSVFEASYNAELARAYCSKTTIKRILKYN